MQVIGILGGTFDPVHCGHLRLALEMREQLFLESVRLIPAAHPPHREPPQASSETRLRMLAAAVKGVAGLCVDARELARGGRSYTVDTLRSLRQSFPEHALCLILGMDAFSGLDRWHRWRELLELAHIAVARRPGASLPSDGEVAALLAKCLAADPQHLGERSAGYLVLRDIPALNISATRVRTLLAQGQSARCLVPDSVLEIITNDRIYADEK